MAEVPDKIIDVIKKFIAEAEKLNIKFQRVVLFGSYANNSYKDWSDIDLAIVSDDFEGIRFYDNLKLSMAIINSDVKIETHPFLPEEFNEENPFVREILATCIRII